MQTYNILMLKMMLLIILFPHFLQSNFKSHSSVSFFLFKNDLLSFDFYFQ